MKFINKEMLEHATKNIKNLSTEGVPTDKTKTKCPVFESYEEWGKFYYPINKTPEEFNEDLENIKTQERMRNPNVYDMNPVDFDLMCRDIVYEGYDAMTQQEQQKMFNNSKEAKDYYFVKSKKSNSVFAIVDSANVAMKFAEICDEASPEIYSTYDELIKNKNKSNFEVIDKNGNILVGSQFGDK